MDTDVLITAVLFSSTAYSATPALRSDRRRDERCDTVCQRRFDAVQPHFLCVIQEGKSYDFV